MIRGSIRTVSLGLAALAATAVGAAADSGPTGVWLDAAGRGAVEIAPCGEGGALCGRVVWVKSATHQKRCGEQILGSLTKGGNGTWGDGWIYSPDRGRKFDVELKQVGDDKLRVIGWAGIRMFSETHYWKRASSDLVKCGREQVASVTATSDSATGVRPSQAPVASAQPPSQPPSHSEALASADPAPAPVPAVAAAKPGIVAKSEAATARSREKRAVSRVGSSTLSPRVEKYFRRTADGTCKVDTPWIRVKFDCKRL